MKKYIILILALATTLVAQIEPADIKPAEIDPGLVATNDTKAEPIAYDPIDTLKPGTINKPTLEAKPVEEGMALIEVRPQVQTIITEDADKIVTTSTTNLTVSPITIPLAQMQTIVEAVVKMGFQTSIPIDASKITSVSVTKDTSPVKVFTTNATVSVVIDTPEVLSYATNLVVSEEGITNEVVTSTVETPAVTHSETNLSGNVVLTYENPVRFTVQVYLTP